MAGKINPEAPEFEDSRKMQWARHFEMRLAYEKQMLEAQGGRAALLEMEVGGWIGSFQIWKVNKSNATGRVAVQILAPARYGNTDKETFQTLNIERLDCCSYRAPTPDALAAWRVILDGVVIDDDAAVLRVDLKLGRWPSPWSLAGGECGPVAGGSGFR